MARLSDSFETVNDLLDLEVEELAAVLLPNMVPAFALGAQVLPPPEFPDADSPKLGGVAIHNFRMEKEL